MALAGTAGAGSHLAACRYTSRPRAAAPPSSSAHTRPQVAAAASTTTSLSFLLLLYRPNGTTRTHRRRPGAPHRSRASGIMPPLFLLPTALPAPTNPAGVVLRHCHCLPSLLRAPPRAPSSAHRRCRCRSEPGSRRLRQRPTSTPNRALHAAVLSLKLAFFPSGEAPSRWFC